MVAYATLNICFKNVCWFQQWDQLKSAMTKLETATLITSVACALKRILNGRLARHYSMCLTPLILTLVKREHLNWYANESNWWSLNCKQNTQLIHHSTQRGMVPPPGWRKAPTKLPFGRWKLRFGRWNFFWPTSFGRWKYLSAENLCRLKFAFSVDQ